MTNRPKTVGARTRESLQGWVSIAIVAFGGVVGSWISYDRGATRTEEKLKAISARVSRLEEFDCHTRLTKVEEAMKHKASDTHTHTRKGKR